jgi:hypothetical protein
VLLKFILNASLLAPFFLVKYSPEAYKFSEKHGPKVVQMLIRDAAKQNAKTQIDLHVMNPEKKNEYVVSLGTFNSSLQLLHINPTFAF